MRESGTLVKWNDGRGFGFIRPDAGGKDVFVHISTFDPQGRRPERGDTILYKADPDADRPKALSAKVRGLTPNQITRICMAISAIGLGTFAAHFLGMLSLPWPVIAYIVVSVLTFSFYWVDKRRAEDGRWRLTETTLHVLAIAGGWPGALAAQQMLRHKTRKAAFQNLFWAIVIVHLAVWCAWFLAPAA